MATATEKNENDGVDPSFTNDDPNLPKMFPEEFVGWHGCVYIILKLDSA
jgi:hypothetical protein